MSYLTIHSLKDLALLHNHAVEVCDLPSQCLIDTTNPITKELMDLKLVELFEHYRTLVIDAFKGKQKFHVPFETTGALFHLLKWYGKFQSAPDTTYAQANLHQGACLTTAEGHKPQKWFHIDVVVEHDPIEILRACYHGVGYCVVIPDTTIRTGGAEATLLFLANTHGVKEATRALWECSKLFDRPVAIDPYLPKGYTTIMLGDLNGFAVAKGIPIDVVTRELEKYEFPLEKTCSLYAEYGHPIRTSEMSDEEWTHRVFEVKPERVGATVELTRVHPHTYVAHVRPTTQTAYEGIQKGELRMGLRGIQTTDGSFKLITIDLIPAE